MRSTIKKIIATFLSLFLISCIGIDHKSKIIHSADMKIVKQEVAKADENSLLVFDCDGVLIMPGDPLLFDANKDFLKSWLKEHNITGANGHKFMTNLFYNVKTRAVNPEMPKLIEDLQKKDIKLLMLTGLPSTPFMNIKDPIAWREKMLASMGYRFEKSSLSKTAVRFGKNPDPVYKNGAIYCGSFSKGKCLIHFLKYFKLHPRKIVFIDDKAKHLEDVAKALAKTKINFIGIEFSELKKLSTKVRFSKELAAKRLEKFYKTGVLEPARSFFSREN